MILQISTFRLDRISRSPRTRVSLEERYNFLPATKLKRIPSPPRISLRAGPVPRTIRITLTHTGARTTTGALLHTDSMHRVSFYFLKIPMDRMPPASARYTYARARTCDHTNPHPRAWLVKNVWVARTQGGKERERSRVEEEES